MKDGYHLVLENKWLQKKLNKNKEVEHNHLAVVNGCSWDQLSLSERESKNM